MRRRLTLVTLLVTGTLCAAPSSARAGGTANDLAGVAPMGMADAWTALANGPAAVFANPAAMAGAKSSALEAGVIRVTMSHDLAAADGGSFTSDTAAILPAVHAVDTMQSKTWAFGLGLAYPLLETTDWSDGSPLATILSDLDLRTMDLRGSLAYLVGQSVSLAAGVDYYRHSLIAERDDESTSGRWRYSGDGNSLGFHAGVKVGIGSQVLAGLTYRSRAAADTDGDLGLLDAAGETSQSSSASCPAEVPAQARLGLAFIPFDDLAIEADAEWTDWSAHDPLSIAPDDGDGGAVFAAGATWEDTIAWRIGVAWHPDKAWTIRAGYFIDPSPVPDGQFDPASPGGDQSGFTFGLGYREGTASVDIAYRLADSDSRDATAGSFETSRQALAASVTFLF